MKGFELLVKVILYMVGLIWWGGGYNEFELLWFCYSECMIMVVCEGYCFIVFFVISCGVYGYFIE